MPLHLHFGLPLFDTSLCAAVCTVIEDRRLLSEESFHQHRANANWLLGTVNGLVHTYGNTYDPRLPILPGDPPPYPIYHVLFDSVALRKMREEEINDWI